MILFLIRVCGPLLFLFLGFPLVGQELKGYLGGKTDPSAILHVITTLDPECPISQKYTHTLNDMATRYADQKVKFYGIMSVQGIKLKEIEGFASYYQISFPCVQDSTLHMARILKASVTPEVFLVDAAFNVIYSGAIDDWFFALGQSRKKASEFFLKEAIESHLSNKPVKRRRVEPVGCKISYRLIREE